MTSFRKVSRAEELRRLSQAFRESDSRYVRDFVSWAWARLLEHKRQAFAFRRDELSYREKVRIKALLDLEGCLR